MAAQAPHFALAPAFANPDVLNYSDQSAAELFKAGTEALSIKVDCKAPKGTRMRFNNINLSFFSFQ
jgi:hypothetical protein